MVLKSGLATLMGKNYALINAALFGFISSLAGFLIVPESHGNGWEYLWITTGAGGFLTAFLFSYFFIGNVRIFLFVISLLAFLYFLN